MKHTTRQTLDLLQRFESPNVTFMEADGTWPIVWERAKGAYVWDAEGKRYLDLTAAFGVAAAGHANPRVVRAGQKQMARLLHAMGDVHPHPRKAELARRLSEITFERWDRMRVRTRAAKADAAVGKTIFCNSGFEAVETALKTALLATSKKGVLAFTGGYHGLGYGALNVTHRSYFRTPFRKQLREFAQFAEYPTQKAHLDRLEKHFRALLRRGSIGAILVEPVQARGGIHVPPPEFLPLLRQWCDENDALLIVDEVYTGFGRTGEWFACEHSATIPDLICLGKALTGGFPLAACVGRSDVIDSAWPRSMGEALHTSTFLGHPVGCAMALAQIREIKAADLVERSRSIGNVLRRSLNSLKRLRGVEVSVRGLGLMLGIELRINGAPATAMALTAVKALLHRGFIVLPEGEHANVIALTPPLILSTGQAKKAAQALLMVLEELTVTGRAGPQLS